MNEHIPSIVNNRKRKLSFLVFVQALNMWLCLDKPSHFFTHKPGQSTNMENNLSSNMHTKLNLIWASEKASQTALNKFLCKINLYYLYLCRNIRAVINATLCLSKQTCMFHPWMNNCVNLVVRGEQEFSFSTFAACVKFPNLFLLYPHCKMFPKSF